MSRIFRISITILITTLVLVYNISGEEYISEPEKLGHSTLSNAKKWQRTSLITDRDPDPEKGNQHYSVCRTCHGANAGGRTNLGGPRLTELQNWYLIRQLKNFRQGIRGTNPADNYGAQMKPMAQTLPDEQAVKDVVAYIKTLDSPAPEPSLQKGDPERGKQFFATCQTCHGADAEGRKNLGGPQLKGQYDWYLVRQLQNFREGIRGTHPEDSYGAQMRPMANSLPDDQAVHDVVAYIQTLDDDDSDE